MHIEFFNPYDIRVPVIAENPTTKESYQLSVLPKSKAELMSGYIISASTAATYPKIMILSGVPKSSEPEPEIEVEDKKLKGK